MNLLVVTYKYPPVLSPRAFRWGALAEHFASEGHRVTVICARTFGAPDREERNGVSVWRVGSGVGTSSQWVQDLGEEREQNPKLAFTLTQAARFVNRVLRWPDYAWQFRHPAATAARSAWEERSFDTLITVSHPFTPHLVGLDLKRRFGVRWIVDIGDPYSIPQLTLMYAVPLYSARSKRAEAAALAAADACCVTTPETRLAYIKLFPGVEGKMQVVPPLAPEPVPDLSANVFLTPGRPKLVYAGSLYRSLRNPGPLLELFRTLREIPGFERAELHFFGSLRDCADLLPDSLRAQGVFTHGIVAREAALSAIAQADVLVNIANASDLQLPSKSVEYAATGKPVLSLSSVQHDCSRRFFTEYPNALVVDAPTLILARAQANVVAEFLSEAPERASPQAVETFLRPYRLGVVAGAYRRMAECAY